MTLTHIEIKDIQSQEMQYFTRVMQIHAEIRFFWTNVWVCIGIWKIVKLSLSYSGQSTELYVQFLVNIPYETVDSEVCGFWKKHIF